MKKLNLAAFLTLFAIDAYSPPPAEACGVKLTIKSGAPRKAVARSSNPSEVLLLGKPPWRLERDLAAAGHRVEVAPTASTAKKKNYAVVITDSSLESEARSNFTESVVMVRSGDVVGDMRSIESQVARKPVAADKGRVVIAAKPVRAPVAAGGQASAPAVVAAREPQEVEPTPPPPAPRVAAAEPRPVAPVAEPKPAPPAKVVAEPRVVTPAEDPKPRTVAKAGTNPGEVHFSLGGSRLGSTRALDRAARWLTDNADIQVTIEGHADPSGTPEGNMELAQKRAEYVRDYLVTAGVDAGRLEVVSFGDTRLKYSATDSRNRRVAFVPK